MLNPHSADSSKAASVDEEANSGADPEGAAYEIEI
jgi:hypothetical protein